MPKPQHLEPQPTEPQPTIVSWHIVTYTAQDETTVTWDEDGTPLVIPLTQFKSHILTDALKTELQLDSDGNYYAIYYET